MYGNAAGVGDLLSDAFLLSQFFGLFSLLSPLQTLMHRY